MGNHRAVSCKRRDETVVWKQTLLTQPTVSAQVFRRFSVPSYECDTSIREIDCGHIHKGGNSGGKKEKEKRGENDERRKE